MKTFFPGNDILISGNYNLPHTHTRLVFINIRIYKVNQVNRDFLIYSTSYFIHSNRSIVKVVQYGWYIAEIGFSFCTYQFLSSSNAIFVNRNAK